MTAALGAGGGGVGFTFTNNSTGTSIFNFTGAYKKVTGYNPATRAVTLDSTFTNPRPAGALATFFPAPGQTRFWYGTNTDPKIEEMLDEALRAGNAGQGPVGIREITGGNLASTYRITAIDKTNKIITITPGFNDWGSATAWIYPCASFGPRCVQDLTMIFAKTGTNTFRSLSDVRFYQRMREDVIGVSVTGGGQAARASTTVAGAYKTVSTAVWGSGAIPTGQSQVTEGRLQVTFNTDDTGAAISQDAGLPYVFRRVPTGSHHIVAYNVAGSDCYMQLGNWNNGRHGATRMRSVGVYYNTCARNCYVATYDFVGNGGNLNSAFRCDYIDLNNNICGLNCYVDARSNNVAASATSGTRVRGWAGGISRIRVFGNSAYEVGIGLGTYMTIYRTIEMYQNAARYRMWVDTALGVAIGTPGGVTISQTSVALIRAPMWIYRNVSPIIHVKNFNVRLATLADSGRNPDVVGIQFTDNLARVYFDNANVWSDVSANTAANTSAVYVANNSCTVFGQPINLTYGGTQCYAIRIIDGNIIRMSRYLPSNLSRIQVSGYTQLMFETTWLDTSMFYTAAHARGREANTIAFRNGALLSVL
jgi:hypothetical protein